MTFSFLLLKKLFISREKGRRKRKLSEAAATVEAEVRSFAEVETSLIRNIGGNNGLNTEVTIKRSEMTLNKAKWESSVKLVFRFGLIL